MDTKVTEKINILTDGVYAKQFFTDNGLSYADAEKIRSILSDKAVKNNLSLDDVERELANCVNHERVNKKLIENVYSSDAYTDDEKLLIFNLNNSRQELSCDNCNSRVLLDFKFCPVCGHKIEGKRLMLIADGEVDFEKGYITTEELKHLRLVTPEENEKLSEDKHDFNEIGIPLTPENCPFEIRDEVISNTSIKDNHDARRELFEKNVAIYREGIDEVTLSSFNNREYSRNKRFPVDKSRIPQEVSVKDVVSSTPTNKVDTTESIDTINSREVVECEDSETNLAYAAVLYLLDVKKHPKKPKVSDNLLYWLKVSSNRKIKLFLNKNNYMSEADNYDLIRANLKQLKVVDLKEILSSNDLKVSGRKDDLIERICENVPENKLRKYSKGKAMKVTSEGEEFLKQYPHVEAYAKYLKRFELEMYEEYYQENKNLSIKDLVLGYLEVVRNYYADNFMYYDVSSTYYEQRRVCSDNKDDMGKLRALIDEFICSLNPWSENAISLNYNYPITLNMQNDIIKVVDSIDIETKKIEKMFKEEAENIVLPGLFLSASDMFQYFIRAFEEENLDTLNYNISRRFDTSKLDYHQLQFNSKSEEKEKYELVKQYFN